MITTINADIRKKDAGIYMEDMMIHGVLVEESRNQSPSTKKKAEAILLLLKKIQTILEGHFSATNN